MSTNNDFPSVMPGVETSGGPDFLSLNDGPDNDPREMWDGDVVLETDPDAGFQVTGIRQKASSKGTPQVEVDLLCLAGKNAGKKTKNWYPLRGKDVASTKAVRARYRHFRHVLGVPVDENTDGSKLSDFVGRKFRATVTVSTQKMESRNAMIPDAPAVEESVTRSRIAKERPWHD